MSKEAFSRVYIFNLARIVAQDGYLDLIDMSTNTTALINGLYLLVKSNC
jgi:hypothetical protein